jgi:hypothetical protein
MLHLIGHEVSLVIFITMGRFTAWYMCSFGWIGGYVPSNFAWKECFSFSWIVMIDGPSICMPFS